MFDKIKGLFTRVNDPLICAICFEKFEYDVQNIYAHSISKKIKHIFHETCIQTWLAIRPNCPVCKGALSVRTLQVFTNPNFSRRKAFWINTKDCFGKTYDCFGKAYECLGKVYKCAQRNFTKENAEIVVTYFMCREFSSLVFDMAMNDTTVSVPHVLVKQCATAALFSYSVAFTTVCVYALRKSSVSPIIAGIVTGCETAYKVSNGSPLNGVITSLTAASFSNLFCIMQVNDIKHLDKPTRNDISRSTTIMQGVGYSGSITSIVSAMMIDIGTSYKTVNIGVKILGGITAAIFVCYKGPIQKLFYKMHQEQAKNFRGDLKAIWESW